MFKRIPLPFKILLAFLILATIGHYGMQYRTLAHVIDKQVPKNEQAIFSDLDEAVTWYRSIKALPLTGISTRETYLQESLQKSALKSLRYSFDMARIQAGLLQHELDHAAADAIAKDEQEDANTVPRDDTLTPEQMRDVIKSRATYLRNQLDAAQRQLRAARRTDRDAINAQIAKLNNELTLIHMQDDLIGNVFDKTPENQTLSLEAQINNLAATLPELENKKTTTTTTSQTPTAAQANSTATTATAAATAMAATQALLTGVPMNTSTTETPAAEKDTKGFLRLIRDFIGRLSQKQDMAELLAETKALQAKNKDKLESSRNAIIAIIKRSNEVSKNRQINVDALVEQSNELQTMTQDFKTMSDFIVPLSKKKRSLSQSAQTIGDWQTLFDEDIAAITKRLLSRLMTILLAITIPFILSEGIRRILLQYVPDARQRRQLNIVRRVILSIAIGLIILLNLVSELGSMATFIGFVTAGLAVALQNVILSIVAHFFFFGRFGVRTGNRVTVNGTTGDVIETGLVRLYLMEMIEEKGQYRATGRIVSFPNSILFQNHPFFKQVPGAHYRWHEITFALSPETERSLARTKLNEATDSIYKDSKPLIDMQRMAMEKSTRLKIKEPRPEGTIDKTADSLNLTIRYPIDSERSEDTDKNIIRQVTEIFERLPLVKMANDEPPVIKKK